MVCISLTASVYPVRGCFFRNRVTQGCRKARSRKKEYCSGQENRLFQCCVSRVSDTGHAVLAGDVAVVDAQAVADAAHADGVFHCVAAALHIAADIQALDDVALGAGGVLLGEGVAVLVALQAAHAHQHGSGVPLACIVRGILQREHPACGLAEVIVGTGLGQLVVALDGSQRIIQCIALKAALGQQVFQCIGLELVSLGLCADLGVLTVGVVGVGLILILGDDVECCVQRIAGNDWRLKNVGVENLTIDSEYDTTNPKDENHAWEGVYINKVKDGWVRMVNFRHLAGSAVVTQRDASRITVEDCISREPVSEIGGYRRRTFLCMGEQCLFQRCYSEQGMHDFAAGLCAAGPNAFVQCDGYESLGYSGAVGPWCTGLLFDNVNIDGNDIKFCNLGLEGYGIGWNTANSLAYQCTAAGIFADSIPDGSNNHVFACWAQFNGSGDFQQCNNHAKPWSRFASLLEKRLGRDVSAQCRVLERERNNVSNNPTYDVAQKMVEEARKPRITMQMWIADSARFMASVPPVRAMDVDKIKERSKKKADFAHAGKPVFAIKEGKIMVADTLLKGARMNTPWWNGRVRYSAFPKIADAVTRFVPGMEGQGTTTRVDSVVAHLRDKHVVLFNQNYGLWYDRRRDDHERVRRRDGDVWAPFYEQPFARSGQGTAWDGLSKYDLTKLNPWYISRMKELAEKGAKNGLLVINQHYFQHNILEAGAHWVDCPWRPVNNINGTVFPEPVPFAGDKRVWMAEYFYNIDNPVMRQLHKQYIMKMLDAFADEPNVIQSIGEEYTGPYHFTKFWLQTVAEWEAKTGKHVWVALSCNKDVQDAILQDPELRKVVDIIHIEQWYYTQKGLYAPEGGKNLAPRQYQRRLRPGKVTYDDVFKSVSEYRQAYPEKAVIYSGASAPENGKAVMDAGGSCPNVK